MGEFTAQELANVGNAVIDFHIKGMADPQTIQGKPLYKRMLSKKKSFPGGKELITKAVKGAYTSSWQGFSHDDEVGYGNPANIKRVSTNWKEMHIGVQVTGTELKHAGITIVDSMTGEKKSKKSGADAVVLTDLWEDKMDDMKEGGERDFNETLWDDGTADPTKFAGIRSFLLTSPSTGVSFGLDRTANSWWRNRASTGISVTTPSDMIIQKTLQDEYRQLRRYGGNPRLWLAGSDFIEAMEAELRAKGTFTQNGWAMSKDGQNARMEASMADISFKGNLIEYDPTLDDIGLAKYLYIIDDSAINLYEMDGEGFKDHTPARPHNKYVYYKAMTWTGGLLARRLNSSGVYSIA